jgi:hypothetical protein
MPGEKAGLARQLQNELNAVPELPSTPSRKIGSRRPRIGHENCIMNEGRVPDDVGDRTEGMTRGQQYQCLHLAVQRVSNVHLKNSDEAKFVKFRTERDRSLPMPALILPALQVNLAGGRLPAPDGRSYLKIPLNAFPHASWGDLEPGLKAKVLSSRPTPTRSQGK